MAKTPAIANPMFVFEALSELQKTKEFNVTYHVARSFEDTGLIVAVYDHSGPGRAKKNYRVSEKGVMVLDKARAALDSVAGIYLDKDGNPIADRQEPIDISSKVPVDKNAKKIADLKAKLAELESGTATTGRKPKERAETSDVPKIDGRTKAGRMARGIAPAVPKTPEPKMAAAIPALETEAMRELRQRMELLEAQLAASKAEKHASTDGKNENGGVPAPLDPALDVGEVGGSASASEEKTVAKNEQPDYKTVVVRGKGGRFEKRNVSHSESAAAA